MTASAGFGHIIANPDDLTFPVVGATTIIPICHSEATEEPQIQYTKLMCGSAEDSVARMMRSQSSPVISGSFTRLRDEDGGSATTGDYFHTQFAAKADHAYFRQLGNVPGSCLLISAPTVQLSAPPVAAASGEGGRGETIQWAGRHDAGISSPTTELQRSALRLHFC